MLHSFTPYLRAVAELLPAAIASCAMRRFFSSVCEWRTRDVLVAGGMVSSRDVLVADDVVGARDVLVADDVPSVRGVFIASGAQTWPVPA